MKYTKEERLEIGRRIYMGELTQAMAAAEYDLNLYTVRDYLRLYKAEQSLTIPKEEKRTKQDSVDHTLPANPEKAQYEKMSKEELIDEIILAKINTERAKKGYEVKGDGRRKQFIPINTTNSKS